METNFVQKEPVFRRFQRLLVVVAERMLQICKVSLMSPHFHLGKNYKQKILSDESAQH